MKKIFLLSALCLVIGSLQAVPAYPGWQTRTQPDGTTIDIQQVGDEYYHYMLNREGKQVALNDAGFYEVVGEAPTAAEARARRAQSPMAKPGFRRIGSPYLAERGLVILVNYADLAIQPEHDLAFYNELFNAQNCINNIYNDIHFGSAANFFSDQSNGAYRPVFDIIGPVTLPHEYAYYGRDLVDKQAGNDSLVGDLIVEACMLVNEQFDIDFSQYDADGDWCVDLVYVIFADKGQANGGDVNTIWPHNWSVAGTMYYNQCTYTWDEATIDGRYINNYVVSAELNSQGESDGIGTLCHEFSHVLGLPDFYETKYGVNNSEHLTPSYWDIMDAGCYNGGGHCPSAYNAWEKYFFGWTSPVNPGDEPANVSLSANGTEEYQAYQINESGELQGACTPGLNYYLENRRRIGWDSYLPAEGMLIWRCDFDEDLWYTNTVNNIDYDPHFTIVCSSGNTVAVKTVYDEEKGNYLIWDAVNDPFPGVDNITSWEGVEGRPLTEITLTEGIITFKYMGGEQGAAIEQTNADATATKLLRDGQVIILRNGQLYNLAGQTL